MRIRDYLEDKAVTLCFLAVGALLFCGAAMFSGIGAAACLIFITLLSICAAAWLCAGFLLQRKRLRDLEHMIEGLPEGWLLGEVCPRPRSQIERGYSRIMQTISSSAIAAVERERRQKEEYFDYVESWIHEMKTPLTACSLILSNGGDARKLRNELKRADNLTEEILFYAKLRSPEKSMNIRQCETGDVMERAVKSQMELLIAARVGVTTQGSFTVSTDDKALCFILQQLLLNSAKHCPGCHITMRAGGGVICVRDDGIGIPAHDLERVCERGFTGENGRRLGSSTGMGLYIVSELCRRLSIELAVDSVQGEYTCVSLVWTGQSGEK